MIVSQYITEFSKPTFPKQHHPVWEHHRKLANRSEFKPQPETRTGIVGPITTDPNEAIRVNGPARAEVVTDLDLGADWPLLVFQS